MLYLELWQTTWSIIRSIQLKELGNNILHTQLKNFAKIRALCCYCIPSKKMQMNWYPVSGLKVFI